jgi:hypothetical protein
MFEGTHAPIGGIEIRIHCVPTESEIAENEPTPNRPTLQSVDSVANLPEIDLDGALLIIFAVFEIRELSAKLLLEKLLQSEVCLDGAFSRHDAIDGLALHLPRFEVHGE